MGIQKATIKIVILFSSDEYPPEYFSRAELSDLEYLMNSDAVGQVEVESIEDVPDTDVERELLALGNDGAFFSSTEGE